MEEEHKEISRQNLDRLLRRIQKYKVRRSEAEVNLAIKGLCLYHCTRQTNILKILTEQKIQIKNLIDAAEHTNGSTDIMQGFDKHISLSIGEPWYSYGNYCFVFGLDKMSEGSLYFFKDPWLFDNKRLEDNLLTKNDFTIFLREMLSRNLLMIRKHFIRIPWNTNLHKLIVRNFKRFEVKQTEPLSILEADEFFMWSQFEHWIYTFSKGIFSRFMLALLIIGIIVKIWLI